MAPSPPPSLLDHQPPCLPFQRSHPSRRSCAMAPSRPGSWHPQVLSAWRPQASVPPTPAQSACSAEQHPATLTPTTPPPGTLASSLLFSALTDSLFIPPSPPHNRHKARRGGRLSLPHPGLWAQCWARVQWLRIRQTCAEDAPHGALPSASGTRSRHAAGLLSTYQACQALCQEPNQTQSPKPKLETRGQAGGRGGSVGPELYLHSESECQTGHPSAGLRNHSPVGQRSET